MKTKFLPFIGALFLLNVYVCNVQAQCPVGYGSISLIDAVNGQVVSTSNPMQTDRQYYIDVTINPPMDPNLVIIVMRSVSGGLGYKNYNGPPSYTIVPFQTIPPAGAGKDTNSSSTSQVRRFGYYSSPDPGDLSDMITVTLRAECSGSPNRPIQTPLTTKSAPTGL